MHLSRRGKRRLFVLLILVLIAAFSIYAFTTIRQMNQQRLIAEARAEGLAAYEAGDIDGALRKLSEFFSYEKSDLEVNLVFAEARSRQPMPNSRHLFEAMDLYTTHGLRLLETDESIENRQAQREEILNRLLRIYGQLGMRLELMQTADELLAIKPDAIDALAAKTEVLYLERRFDAAIAVADRLLELDPENLRWRRLWLRLQRDRGMSNEQLVATCRQWAQEWSEDGRYHLLAAGLLIEMNRLDEARTELEAVGRLGAGEQEVLDRAVALLDMLEMRSEADQLIAQTQRARPTEAWVREVSLRRLWHANQIDSALAELQRIEQEFASLSPGLQQLKVTILISANQLDKAREALKPLLHASTLDKERDDDRAWAAALATALETDKADWQAALQALRNALSLAPQDAVLHFLMGDACMKVGEHAQAVASFHEAYTLEPNWMAAGIAYAESLLIVGRADEAFRVSRAVFTQAPKDRVAPFLLFARAYLSLFDAGVADQIVGADRSMLPELINMLDEVCRQLPGHAEAATRLVEASVHAGRRDHALEFIEQRAADSAPDPDVLLALANVSRKYQLGADQVLLSRAREVAGLTVPVAFAMAERLAAEGKHAEGLKLIDEAMDTASLDEARLRMARCARCAYLIEMNHPQAMEALTQVVADYPDSVQVQQFVLSLPAAWDDARLMALTMAGMKRTLGEHSQQVRLAEANFLLRHHGDDESKLARAIVQISSVLDESPSSLAALSMLAEASMMGPHPNLSRATDALERAVLLYPGEPSLVVRLVNLLQRRGDFDRAARHLQHLAQLSAINPQLKPTELRLLRAQGDFEAALVRAAAIVNESSSVADQLVLAAMNYRAGRRDAAEEIYARLLAEPDPDSIVLSEAAEFYAATGRFDHGLELLRRVPADGNMARQALMLGSFYQRHGRVDHAGQWLRRAVELDPNSPDARNELARHYISVQDQSAAREQAMAGLKLDPEHASLRATLAIANLSAPGADRKEAIELLRELGAENDSLLAALSLLEKVPVHNGTTAPTASNLAEARRLVEEHGGFLPCWLLAISLHVEAGKLNEAITLARRAISRLPGQPEPAQWATQLLIDARRWNEALVEAQEWRRRALADPLAADTMIALILLEQLRPRDAVAQLQPHQQQVVSDRDRAPDRFALYIRALTAAGQYDQAISLIAPLLNEDAKWRQLWLSVLPNFTDDRLYDALVLLDSGVTDAGEILALAGQWTAFGQRTANEEYLNRAESLAAKLANNPQFAVSSLLTRGAVAEARGDGDAAEALYRQALELEPENAIALNNLAYVLATLQKRPDEALPHIQKAVELRPNVADLLDTRGVVLMGIGDFDAAEQAFAQAMSLRPGDAAIAFNMIELYLTSSRVDKAMRLINEIEERWRTQAQVNQKQRERLDDLRQRMQSAQAAMNPDQG